MDTNTPYEDLIAAKLEQVPVPDMADSIWAGIEMQLDTPVDVPGKKTTPKIKGKGWYGFAVITAAVTSLWWFSSRTNHPPQNITPQRQITVPEITPAGTDSHTIRNNTEKKIIPVLPIPLHNDSLQLEEKPDSVMSKDSVVERVLPLMKMEPRPRRQDKPVTPAVDSASLAPLVKKPKGVKGISSDDYKISAKKDSTGKTE